MNVLDVAPKWKEGINFPRFERLRDPIPVDVAIIGSGFTGIVAACFLKQAGRERAQATWHVGQKAIDRIEAMVSRERIDNALLGIRH